MVYIYVYNLDISCLSRKRTKGLFIYILRYRTNMHTGILYSASVLQSLFITMSICVSAPGGSMIYNLTSEYPWDTPISICDSHKRLLSASQSFLISKILESHVSLLLSLAAGCRFAQTAEPNSISNERVCNVAQFFPGIRLLPIVTDLRKIWCWWLVAKNVHIIPCFLMLLCTLASTTRVCVCVCTVPLPCSEFLFY